MSWAKLSLANLFLYCGIFRTLEGVAQSVFGFQNTPLQLIVSGSLMLGIGCALGRYCQRRTQPSD